MSSCNNGRGTEIFFAAAPEEERIRRGIVQSFYQIVEGNPMIAAVKDMGGLEKSCAAEEIQVIFVLFGDICTIRQIVERIKEAGKMALVHIDLITGLSSKEVTVDFMKENTRADGIITTKQPLAHRAKELGMYAVLRFFVIDSMALKSIESLDRQKGGRPDFIEVLPGVMPKVIRKICGLSRIPVIAGGLIADKEDVMGALGAGAVAVSTTKQEVWML